MEFKDGSHPDGPDSEAAKKAARDARRARARSAFIATVEDAAALVDSIITEQHSKCACEARQLVTINRLLQRYIQDARDRLDRDEAIAGWTPEAVGFQETTSEVALALSLPESTAANLVSTAQALVEIFPHTLTALRTGNISIKHAEAIVETGTELPPHLRTTFETAILPGAGEVTVAKLKRKARKLRDRLDPTTIEERTSKAAADRNVWMEAAPDGMAYLTLFDTAEKVVAIMNRIHQTAQLLTGPTEDRVMPQLEADVTTDLLINGHTDGDYEKGIHPTILITVPIETITGVPTGGPASRVTTHEAAEGDATDTNDADNEADADTAGPPDTAASGAPVESTAAIDADTRTAPYVASYADVAAVLEGYGPISAERARFLAAGSPTLIRVLTDPVSGAVLQLGRTRYRMTAELRAFLRTRDVFCRKPNCQQLAAHSDVDHTWDWLFGGLTNDDNCAHLCPKHHREKHHTRLRVQQIGGGVLEWTTPAGKSYRSYPEHLTRTVVFVDNENDTTTDGGANAPGGPEPNRPPGNPPPPGGNTTVEHHTVDDDAIDPEPFDWIEQHPADHGNEPPDNTISPDPPPFEF